MRFFARLTISLALAMVAPAQALSDAGALAHFAYGGGWRTTFFLLNTGAAAAQVQLNFFTDTGQAAVIPLRLPQLDIDPPPAAQFGYTLNPGTVLTVESDSSSPVSTTGWAQLKASTGVTGYLIFRYAGVNGLGVQEAVVTPETRSGKSYVIDFDNTNQHFTTFAIANVTDQSVDVTITARDAVTGTVLGTSTILTLPSMSHQAYVLGSFIPDTLSASGTIEFATGSSGQISVLGLRFTQPSNAFTSIPPVMKQ